MNEQLSHQHLDTEAGAAVYSPLVLKLYDWWVLGISNRLAWQCSTKTVLGPFYKAYMGRRHLDVGVGTGFYPAHANLSRSQEIALLDLNKNSLHAAAARLGQRDVRLLIQDVMRPLSLSPDVQ